MESAGHSRKQPRVLVVDDTATLRQMARDALEEDGLEVVEAADGRAALEVVAEQRPDLVLMDVNMPVLDGCAACHELRLNPEWANLPVLMMTASDDVESMRTAYEAGATDFITKPINWLILCQRVRYMLRMSRTAADLERSQVQLAKAQRSAGLGNWELDLRSGAFRCSDEVCGLYELPRGQLATPAALLERIHPEDRDLVGTALELALSDGTPFSVDHRIQLSDGPDRHVHLQGEVSTSEDGDPLELSGTAQDVSGRKRAEEEVRFLAYHDSLTRLGNQRLFRDRLNHGLAQARRQGEIVGVVLLDLDHFKRINDTFGHSVGDMLLQRVADRLQNCVREGDTVTRSLVAPDDSTVSRFGGDEFMVLLPSVRRPQEAGHVARRVVDVLAHPFDLDGHQVVVTASAGISIGPTDGEDVDALLRNAVAAMYAAKERARGSYQFYERSMNDVVRRNLELEGELRAALDADQLSVHYQPKVELATNRITSVEALVRWTHPELGSVPPGQFVPVAEQAGLIVAVGEFVLRTACAQTRRWHEAGFEDLRISVNLSAQQLRTDEITFTVSQILHETGLLPKYLDVEITESMMIENKGVAIAALHQLKGVGITVSLDDFGTGYSSLSYLNSLPVDFVKIDRTFVSAIGTDPNNAVITAAIISMAHTLGLQVVAEGVETEEQRRFLLERDCDEMQGYLFSKPLPADELTELLRNHQPQRS